MTGLEVIAGVAAAIVALGSIYALTYKIYRSYKAKQAQKLQDQLMSLAVALQNAKTDEERKKLLDELYEKRKR